MHGRDIGNAAVAEHWEDVLGDRDELTDAYEARGWDAYPLTPGHVTLIEDGDDLTISILLSKDELETINPLIETLEFDSVDVYRRVEGGTVFVLMAMEATDAQTSLIIPMYYSTDQIPQFESLRDAGRPVECLLRSLDDAFTNLLRIADADLFIPE